MSIDVIAGYDPQDDYMLLQKPDNPEMRESVSMWISDNEGRFGFPRFCIEVIAGQWSNRGVEANIAFPDGRVLIGAGGFEGAPASIVNGKAVTLNAGPLTFEVVEPLKRWIMTFDGDAYETTVQKQMQGEASGPTKRVEIRLEATMAVPPWTPGEKAIQSGDQATESAVGAIGGHRHEQLFRCSGSFKVQGEQELAFEGTGLKIRRVGLRNTGDFPGHCWQSAVFPSGKAFGMLSFPPRKDGTPAYGEGFIFDGKKKIYADVVKAPWMTEFVPHDGPVDVLLQTEAGPVRIEGRTHDSTFIRQGNPMFGSWQQDGSVAKVKLPFHQGGALYTWEGESAYGMIERSLPTDQLKL